MARKEIKIFMDSKEVSNFLKVIDWSWLFTFLSERYNVSLSPPQRTERTARWCSNHQSRMA